MMIGGCFMELVVFLLCTVLFVILDTWTDTEHVKNSTRIKNRLHQTLRSKYPYMSDEDIDKMVRKTLRIK